LSGAACKYFTVQATPRKRTGEQKASNTT
jgi:hypothetical protein